MRGYQLTSGPIPNGFYKIRKDDRYGATQHLGGSTNSKYGPGGIIHFQDYTGIRGNLVTGSGLHAGRANWTDPVGHRGVQCNTLACTRTTDFAMWLINSVAKVDPLEGFIVVNNDENILRWEKDAGLIPDVTVKIKKVEPCQSGDTACEEGIAAGDN